MVEGDLMDGRLAALKFQAEDAVQQGDVLRSQVRVASSSWRLDQTSIHLANC
jgi:hypothetical protein